MGLCQSKNTTTSSQQAPEKKKQQKKPAPQASNGTSLKRSNREAIDVILNLTNNKPLDASDVVSQSDTKHEIRFIRKFAAEFLATLEDANVAEDNNTYDALQRGALYDKQDFSSFKKISYDKSDGTRNLIYDAIKANVLFEQDTRQEILSIVDVFKPRRFKKGECVIKQGDEGDDFFVVESGHLEIHVTVQGENEEVSEVKVGEYTKGSAFGELALIFGSPRAATINATSDCKLWSVERMAYRSVISQMRYDQHIEKTTFLKACVVSGRSFIDIFDPSQIEDLTIATKMDVYEEGQVLLREGEMGDTFYIVKSGRVERYRRDKYGEERADGVVEEKKAFGTTSLLKGTPSPVTYKAASQVSLYYLTRSDFEEIMGSFKDALDGTIASRGTIKSESKRTVKTSMSHMSKYDLALDELDIYNVLGRGAFGKVNLVQWKKEKKVFALKAQSKHYIIKKGQKEHVLNEYRILKEFDHPNILGIHCAMQDKQHLYFLLDLLPGGELMSYLIKKARQGKGFTEDITRFYAASIVLAYEYFHPLLIAYRDLKPENIVLTKKGYGVLVDFGLAKEIDEGQSFTFCGTPDYLAPEIIRGTGHDWAVDYWGLGVFLFEMTNGTAPFYATNQARRTRKILKGFEFVKVPSHFSAGLSDLISDLLVNDPAKRLGRTQIGVQAIKNHHWFAGFDWEGFNDQMLKAPIQPVVPSNIRELGNPKLNQKNPFPDSDPGIASEWWPDLMNLEEW